MIDWYWNRERTTSNAMSFIKEFVGVTRIETYYDAALRVQRFLAFFSYCNLSTRQERQASLGYAVTEEELFMARNPEVIIQCIAESMRAMKLNFNDFNLEPDPQIIRVLNERNCTDIAYDGHHDTYTFVNINGDRQGPIQPSMLEYRLDIIAPRESRYPHECLGCKFFENNPYLPCAVNPMFASRKDESEYCAAHEPR